MKALKYWKAILAMVLVFAAGVVTGSLTTMLHFKHAVERGFNTKNWTAGVMKDMQNDLNLTPEQQPKIKAILDGTAHQFEGSFGLAIKESGTNLVDCWRQIDKELTPEQRVVFQRKCQEFRVGLKRKLKIELPPQ